MLYYIMSDTTNHSINYNNEDHNTEDADEFFNVKRISIPIDKVKDFIQLIYGDQEIMIMNATMRDNYLDLTNKSVIVL